MAREKDTDAGCATTGTANPVAYREPTQIVTFVYRNWKGEIRERRVVPINIEFKSDRYYHRAQWIMHAIDIEKGARRSFAFRDMLTAPKGE